MNGGAERNEELLRVFREAATTRAQERGISPTEHNWNLVSVAEDAGLNLFNFSRDAELMNSIWVCFLSVMKDFYAPGDMKYPTMEDFLSPGAYPDFVHCSPEEQNNLWMTANWMSILFTMVPAAKNKGLVLQVVPHLVEGANIKYITGSGQTEATANRVHIYEREGNIVATHRSSIRAARRKPAARGKSSTKKTPLRRRSDSLGSGGGGSGHRSKGLRDPNRVSRNLDYGGGMGENGIVAYDSGGGVACGGAPSYRRPRSGTESSTDAEYRSNDDEMLEDDYDVEGDEEENGTIREEEVVEDEDGDFVNVLQLLRDSSNSTKYVMQGRGMASSSNGGGYSPTQGGLFPSAFSFSAGSDGTVSPGLSQGPPLERIHSWGGMTSAGTGVGGLRNPLVRLSSTDFQNQPAFPPDHPSYHGVVSPPLVAEDPLFDMFTPLDPTRSRK